MYHLGHIRQLESGFSFSVGGFTGGWGFEANTLRPDCDGWYEACAGWQILGPQILQDWIEKKPGERPWAWWHLDKRERRNRIDGKVHPHDNPERIALVEAREAEFPGSRANLMKLYYGVPGALCCSDDFTAVYESECEFIDRQNLWLPGEITAGIPVLRAEIAALKRSDDPRSIDLLRRAQAMLARLTKKAATG
jgi:hypothetical protein